MSRIEIDLNPTQIKEAFEQLNIREKLKLVREFEKETRHARWNDVINKIRQRSKKYPISKKEIARICKGVREEHHERNKSCR